MTNFGVQHRRRQKSHHQRWHNNIGGGEKFSSTKTAAGGAPSGPKPSERMEADRRTTRCIEPLSSQAHPTGELSLYEESAACAAADSPSTH